MKMKVILSLTILLAFLLRFFQLGKNPPSLYWDEASLGYNAFTIATSGKDEHGEVLPLDRFIAFGDYKPPGYIYAAVPGILLFGLNEFAVRLPSMIAGFLMVVVTYLLTKELFHNEKVALLSSFFLSISSWAVHFSRASFEANLAAFFNLCGIYFFVLSKKRKWLISLSVVFFILSFYTFNANRIIAPLMLIALSVFYFKNLLRNRKWVFASLVIAVILTFPSVGYLRNRESRLRFQEVSIFNNITPIKISNQRIELDHNAWWAKIIHNRRAIFSVYFLKHYFDNFTGRFLFTHGDANPRLAVQNMGQLYIWVLPFLLFGIYLLIISRRREKYILFFWMLIASIPAGMARETPHALRILSLLPTYQIIIACGLYQFNLFILRWSSRLLTTVRGVMASTPFQSATSDSEEVRSLSHPRWLGVLLLSALCFLLSLNIFYYLHNYYIHYPFRWSGQWQYGYKQMVNYVSSVEDKYDSIFVTNALGRPYIYFAFYKKLPVQKFLAERKASRDWFGFWNVSSLRKVWFNFNNLEYASGRILVVTTPGNLPTNFYLIKKIKNLSGDDVFLIGEKT